MNQSEWVAELSKLDGDAQIKEVYARFGVAIYFAQVLEHGIVNALTVFEFIPRASDFSSEEEWTLEYDNFVEGEFQNTLGKLVRKMNEHSIMDEQLRDKFSQAVQRRNALAHRFFGDSAEDFLSTAGRAKMIVHCEECREHFSNTDHLLEQKLAPIRSKYGIDEKKVEEVMSRMFEEAIAESE
ncbi:hypothetical protein [uncultured Parasphingopyxis sp.]|uniref:hypothetical protein n=1 Tax=uncultured Parasphingopyxis sp. TaxID=1547918 RepID=UPI002607635A|nr:hypothetical protein [uncultured Parasphingopyxis sp.]